MHTHHETQVEVLVIEIVRWIICHHWEVLDLFFESSQRSGKPCPGRWEDYGPELLRLTDRHQRDFCFGPTHELDDMVAEVMTRAYATENWENVT
ncbi:MAG TPA: hypothetical protein EYO80_00925, partial [Candidatus Marinimicrobia bacterium]|nr:hypothetical protein [Candidatus Neomarinimicrobiota bacterium]